MSKEAGTAHWLCSSPSGCWWEQAWYGFNGLALVQLVHLFNLTTGVKRWRVRYADLFGNLSWSHPYPPQGTV